MTANIKSVGRRVKALLKDTRIKVRQMTNSLYGHPYDFCDFGSSNGGSINFGMFRLGAQRGIGLDIDPRKVRKSIASGYDAVLGDMAQVAFPSNHFKFTIISHVLEHLPNMDIAHAGIGEALRISNQFVFIRGPFFDADAYLESLGLKFYWSDWIGHTLHLTVTQLSAILQELEVEHYEIYGAYPVVDSMNDAIHPLSTPTDSHQYVQGKHDPKEHISFEQPIYREFICIIPLNGTDVQSLMQLIYPNGVLLDAYKRDAQPTR